MPRRAASALLLAAALASGAACARAGRAIPPPPAGTDDAAAREVLGRFARALEGERFPEAHALLSARWRAAYTPGRLALDFRGAGPAARDAARLAAQAAAAERVERSREGARVAVGGGRAALLVVEDGGWRVDALE